MLQQAQAVARRAKARDRYAVFSASDEGAYPSGKALRPFLHKLHGAVARAVVSRYDFKIKVGLLIKHALHGSVHIFFLIIKRNDNTDGKHILSPYPLTDANLFEHANRAVYFQIIRSLRCRLGLPAKQNDRKNSIGKV